MQCPNCNKEIIFDNSETEDNVLLLKIYQKEVLNTKEASIFLGYTYETMLSKISREEVPYRGKQGARRFIKSELISWLKAGMPDRNTWLYANKFREAV